MHNFGYYPKVMCENYEEVTFEEAQSVWRWGMQRETNRIFMTYVGKTNSMLIFVSIKFFHC